MRRAVLGSTNREVAVAKASRTTAADRYKPDTLTKTLNDGSSPVAGAWVQVSMAYIEHGSGVWMLGSLCRVEEACEITLEH